MKEKIELYEAADDLLMRAKALGDTVRWITEQINLLVEKYNNEEEVEGLKWEEREALHKKSDELLGRLRGSIGDLSKLNDEYDRLRGKANEHYGRGVMPPVDGRIEIPPMGIGDDGLE